MFSVIRRFTNVYVPWQESECADPRQAGGFVHLFAKFENFCSRNQHPATAGMKSQFVATT